MAVTSPLGRGLTASAGLPAPRVLVRLGVGVLLLIVLGLSLAVALDGLAVSLPLALAGGVGLVGLLALCVVRFDWAVGLGFVLLGVVRFEPAPPDGAFAIIMAVAVVTGRFDVRRTPQAALLTSGALLVVGMLSLLDAVDSMAGLRFFFITGYLAFFAVWLTGYLRGPEATRRMVLCYLAIALFSAVISSAALYLPLPGRDFILGSYDGDTRAGGFFKDPNVYGPFLVPIALIVLEQRISPRARPLLRMSAASSFLVFTALSLGVLFSYSRAAWANLVLAVGVMLVAASVRKRGARRAMRALVTLSVAVVLGGVVLVATGAAAFLQERAKLQSYDTERFAAQHLGWDLGWQHLLGIGPGQFQFYSDVETHSTYVRVFAEQGPLGLVLWVALLVVTLVLALRNVARGTDTYGIGSAALLAAWVGLVFNSFVVDTLHWRHLWVVAACIWAGAARRTEPAGASPSPQRLRAASP